MRVVTVRRHGGPEVLEFENVPEPVPGDGELVVEVGAAGVTLPIVRQLRGGGGLPFRPGGEVAGRVLAIGPCVTGWSIGSTPVLPGAPISAGGTDPPPARRC